MKRSSAFLLALLLSSAAFADGLIPGGGGGSGTITAGTAGQVPVYTGATTIGPKGPPNRFSASPPTALTVLAASPSMFGLASGGTYCQITPAGSGNVRVNISGSMQMGTASQAGQAVGKYGTGTPPINQAAAVGTTFGNASGVLFQASGVELYPFIAQGYVTGLTVGTTYWFDLVGYSANSTMQIANPQCTLIEL